MTRLVGTCVGASTAVAIVLLFIGPQGAWAFVVYGWIQALLAAIFGYNTVNSEWAEVEGVKVTPEGYIAPLGFLILNTILLFNMGDILYLSLIHISRCRRYSLCRSRWSPYH